MLLSLVLLLLHAEVYQQLTAAVYLCSQQNHLIALHEVGLWVCAAMQLLVRALYGNGEHGVVGSGKIQPIYGARIPLIRFTHQQSGEFDRFP